MGCGKSATGRRLAQKIGWQFIDTDTFIENRYHKSVPILFTEIGETKFREIERNIIQELSDYENVVIATGGGLACHFENMKLMNACGLTVYLKNSAQTLAERLKHARVERPLLKGKTEKQLYDYIVEMLTQREPFYTQAHLTIDCNNSTDFSHIDKIIETLNATEI